MKKMLLLFCALVLSLALVYAPAQAQTKFGFKITGGLGYLGGGDLNTGLQGWSDAWSAIFGGSGYTVTGGYSAVHLGMDIGGEFLLQFDPSMAIGLGVGYLQASKSSTLTMTGFGSSAAFTWAPKVSAIPITATFYYFLPSSGRVRIFLDAGLGYYLGKYTDAWHLEFFGPTDETLDTTANGIGFHGGLGIEVPFSPAISFLFEARGRYASLGNFKGTDTTSFTSTTGDVWIENLDTFGLGTFPLLTIDTGTPSSSTTPRQAKLDLSGFSAVIGFLFHF
jgi:opacity protein-like surface antigen